MPERTGLVPGEFAWADLMTSDVDAAVTFYRTVFGWEADVVPEPEARGYTMFTLGGKQVGAVSPVMPGDPTPPHWNVYVGVTDADLTLKSVEAAGGTVVVPAMDVFTAGRMAMAADPAGAVFALWQAGDHHGAGVTDEPGSLTWVELSTTDTEGAKAFYGEVFGWGEQTADGGGMPYTEFKQGGKSIAGMMPAQGGMPPFWMPYFQTTDPDKVAGEVAALGGQVLAPPADIPGGDGRYAVVTDPQGAPFGLYRP